MFSLRNSSFAILWSSLGSAFLALVPKRPENLSLNFSVKLSRRSLDSSEDASLSSLAAPAAALWAFLCLRASSYFLRFSRSCWSINCSSCYCCWRSTSSSASALASSCSAWYSCCYSSASISSINSYVALSVSPDGPAFGTSAGLSAKLDSYVSSLWSSSSSSPSGRGFAFIVMFY